jgi:glycosyltransferase involved in cell wall biosynthesis
MVIDSQRVDLSAYRKSLLLAAEPGVLPLPQVRAAERGVLDLDGVVYTAIFNPHDARKNWMEMISGFCDALRHQSDATLLIKLTHHDPAYKMGRMSCRVLLVHAYLQRPDYNALLRATTYAINTSHGEGQCLPLMEYMSAGKPALAPRHTSMRDYVNEDGAFVIESSAEPGTWPHDQRQVFRTLRQRIHYQSVVQAYRRSYHVARHEPQVYAAMGNAAAASLQRYCSIEVVRPRLHRFIHDRLQAASSMDTLHADPA